MFFNRYLGNFSYNILRGSLLYKTKTIELQENISGLPQVFNFRRNTFWGKLYTLSRYLFWAFIIAVIYNTVKFLFMRVPI